MPGANHASAHPLCIGLGSQQKKTLIQITLRDENVDSAAPPGAKPDASTRPHIKCSQEARIRVLGTPKACQE
jgi:hypothetical protein